MAGHTCRESSDPRRAGYCACGQPCLERPRDLALERYLDSLAVRAAGLPADPGLGRFADQRAHPGGVRVNLDPRREAMEEAADARNYCVWGIERIWTAYQAGDSQAAAEYQALMGALTDFTAGYAKLLAR